MTVQALIDLAVVTCRNDATCGKVECLTWNPVDSVLIVPFLDTVSFTWAAEIATATGSLCDETQYSFENTLNGCCSMAWGDNLNGGNGFDMTFNFDDRGDITWARTNSFQIVM